MKTVLLAIALFITCSIHAQDVDPKENSFIEQLQPFFGSCKKQFNLKDISVTYVNKWKRTLVIDFPDQFNTFKEFEDFAKKVILRGSVSEISGQFTTKFGKFWEAQLTLNYVVNAKGPNDQNYGYAEVERF